MDSDSAVVNEGLHFKQTLKDKVLSTLSRTGMRWRPAWKILMQFWLEHLPQTFMPFNFVSFHWWPDRFTLIKQHPITLLALLYSHVFSRTCLLIVLPVLQSHLFGNFVLTLPTSYDSVTSSIALPFFIYDSWVLYIPFPIWWTCHYLWPFA